SSGSSPTCRWIKRCCRMLFKKSSKARQAARGDALLDGALWGEPAARGADGAVLPREPALREPARPAHGVAAAHAGARPDPRALWLPTPARDDASGRLGCGQAPVLSGVHRRGAGAQTEAALAPCDRRASGAPATRAGAE